MKYLINNKLISKLIVSQTYTSYILVSLLDDFLLPLITNILFKTKYSLESSRLFVKVLIWIIVLLYFECN